MLPSWCRPPLFDLRSFILQHVVFRLRTWCGRQRSDRQSTKTTWDLRFDLAGLAFLPCHGVGAIVVVGDTSVDNAHLQMYEHKTNLPNGIFYESVEQDTDYGDDALFWVVMAFGDPPILHPFGMSFAFRLDGIGTQTKTVVVIWERCQSRIFPSMTPRSRREF